MIAESFVLANTLAGLPRALTENEHAFYDATLRLGASMLRGCEAEARAKEILAELKADELRDLDGDGDPKSK